MELEIGKYYISYMPGCEGRTIVKVKEFVNGNSMNCEYLYPVGKLYYNNARVSIDYTFVLAGPTDIQWLDACSQAGKFIKKKVALETKLEQYSIF